MLSQGKAGALRGQIAAQDLECPSSNGKITGAFPPPSQTVPLRGTGPNLMEWAFLPSQSQFRGLPPPKNRSGGGPLQRERRPHIRLTGQAHEIGPWPSNPVRLFYCLTLGCSPVVHTPFSPFSPFFNGAGASENGAMPDFPGDSRVGPTGKTVENGAKTAEKRLLLRFREGRFPSFESASSSTALIMPLDDIRVNSLYD